VALDLVQILDLIHAVSRPMTRIQVLQPFARKFRAVKAIMARAFMENAKPAMHAGLWPVHLGVPASWEGWFGRKCDSAHRIIHSARGNEVSGAWTRHFQFPD